MKIGTRVFREVQDPNNPKVKFLEPVDVELHANPVSIGIGALALGAGLAGLALAAWWAGLGLNPIEGEELRHRRDILAFKRRQLAELTVILKEDGDLSPQNRANIEKTIITLQGDIKVLARETRFGVRIEKRERFSLFGL